MSNLKLAVVIPVLISFFFCIFFSSGSFEEDKAEAPIKFFQVSGGVDGDMTSSDNFDWPR